MCQFNSTTFQPGIAGVKPVDQRCDDAALFSRTGTSHPLGKLCEIEKAPVPEIVSDVITHRAREAGMSRAELIREVLCWWACPEQMESVLEARRRVAVMNRTGNSQVGQ